MPWTLFAWAAMFAPVLAAPPAFAADPAPVKLLDLQGGDRGCYVVVQAGNAKRSLEGDFDLCPGGAKDASRLIGKMVSYATRPGKVQAASCGGDPSCKKTDSVDLVVRLAPADSPVKIQLR